MMCSDSQEGDPEQVEPTNDTLLLAEYPLDESEETVGMSVEQVVVNGNCFVDEPVVQVVDDFPPAHSSSPTVSASDDELRGPEDCALQRQLKESEMLEDELLEEQSEETVEPSVEQVCRGPRLLC